MRPTTTRLFALLLPFVVACQGDDDDNADIEETNTPLAEGTAASALLSACGDAIQSNGELCYQPAASLIGGLTNVYGVWAGHVNGGANVDVVAISQGTDRLRIGLGNGAGGLLGNFTYVTGLSPTDVDVGDFNNDGNPDIVTADFGTDQARVRSGNGANFNSWAAWNMGNGTQSVRATDLDDDESPSWIPTRRPEPSTRSRWVTGTRTVTSMQWSPSAAPTSIACSGTATARSRASYRRTSAWAA